MSEQNRCPATREAVEELLDVGLGPDCEICGRGAQAHEPEEMVMCEDDTCTDIHWHPVIALEPQP